MKKLLFILLAVTLFAGCQPYHIETNTTFGNVAPVERENLQLHINKVGSNIGFTVTESGNIVSAEQYIFRNDNTHELYSNYGTNESIVYTLSEDGDYTFGFYKDDIEIIYNFKLSELKETQTINY